MIAAACATAIPTGTEPVKEMRPIPGCADSAAPASAPSPGTTLSTPAGTPASWMISASRRHESGASSAGFSTQQLPAASDGAIVRVPIPIG